MPAKTYLILIKDDDLAEAVAAALRDRLGQAGGPATAVIPAFRHLSYASWRPGLVTAPGTAPRPAGRCHAVSICEPGLLDGLKSLGLPAWVGIPAHEPPATIRWNQHTAVRLIPITTASDLIDAIAASTTWPSPAVPAPAARRRSSRPAARPALSRRLIIASTATAAAATAGAAGTILLTGATTAAAANPAPATLTAYTAPNVVPNSPVSYATSANSFPSITPLQAEQMWWSHHIGGSIPMPTTSAGSGS